MNRAQFQVTVAGQTLHGNLYRPEKAVAVVIIVHGMGEYGRRYERSVIPALLKNGIAVIAYNQFGHGMNSGKKGHHPGYRYLMDSIDNMILKAEKEFPGQPVYLYGHSMGGNVALNYGLRRPGRITGMVVTSPFLQLAFEPPAWKLKMGKLLAGIWPSMTMANEIDPGELSQIQEEVEAYRQDPLVHDRVSPAYSIEFIEKGEWAMQNAGDLKVPTLLIHGTADRITSCRASEEFAQGAGKKVDFMPIEGGYHELHHDLEKDRVLDAIVKWIRKDSL